MLLQLYLALLTCQINCCERILHVYTQSLLHWALSIPSCQQGSSISYLGCVSFGTALRQRVRQDLKTQLQGLYQHQRMLAEQRAALTDHCQTVISSRQNMFVQQPESEIRHWEY